MKQLLVILILMVLVTIPAFAQDNATHSLTFNGFTFAYSSDFATNVNVFQREGIAPNSDFGFGMPALTSFVLYIPDTDMVNPRPIPESAWDAAGGIIIFDTADFAGYDEETSRLENLQVILNERPDLSMFETVDTTLPYLPVYPAGQTFRSQAHYIDTAQVQGIAFVTMYQEAAEPFLRDSLYYTFQGISVDSQHYVSVVVPLETSILPENTDATFDYQAFYDNLNEYMIQTMADVDALSADDFSPSLDTIDALIESFAFDSIHTP